MNGEDILKAMGEVKEQYIHEADTVTPAKKGVIWLRLGTVAACAVLVLAAGKFMLADVSLDCAMENANAPCETAAGMLDEENHWEQTPAGVQEIESDMADSVDDPVWEPGYVPSDSAGQEPGESPCVVIQILSWQEDGFTAVVEKQVDTDVFAVGTELSVKFADGIRILENDGQIASCTVRKPTREDFPEGTVVQVMFVDRTDGEITVSQIGKENAF